MKNTNKLECWLFYFGRCLDAKFQAHLREEKISGLSQLRLIRLNDLKYNYFNNKFYF